MAVPAFVERGVQKMAGSAWFRKIGPSVVPPMDRFVYRITRGRVLTSQYLVPSLILVNTGAKSGLVRETPLACMPTDDGIYIVGSNYGREAHPAWTHNLLAHPECGVKRHGDEWNARARLLDDDEKAEVWPRLLEVWPVYDQYVQTSGRELRVFRLERV